MVSQKGESVLRVSAKRGSDVYRKELPVNKPVRDQAMVVFTRKECVAYANGDKMFFS